MTIASALTALNTDITNARAAITAKGGTVTSGGGSSQLATDIATIPSGSSGVGIPREVKNGVYQMPTENFSFSLPNNATDISAHGLSYAFYGCTGLTSVDLSSLTTIGNSGLYFAITYCTGLTSVDLSSLTTVKGSGLYSAFQGCTGLMSVDLSSLTTVGSNGLSSAFYNCKGLTSIDLPSLTTVSGSSGLSSAFYGCTGLTSVSFPALTTSSFGSYKNQFTSMLSSTGTKVTHTLHFPSNLQSTISGLTGYPNFGGINGYVVCAFDLPATS